MLVVETSSTYTQIKNRYGRYNRGVSSSPCYSSKHVYQAFDSFEQVDVAWHSLSLDASSNMTNSIELLRYYNKIKQLNHPNIFCIKDVWINDDNTLCYITDMNINSTQNIPKFCSKHKVSIHQIKQVCKQLLTVLHHLHQRNICGINLQTDHIYLNERGWQIALDISDAPAYLLLEYDRSLYNSQLHFQAPELYKEAPLNGKFDVWAFGMCILEMVTSKIPYNECNKTVKLYQALISGTKPADLIKINDRYIRDFILLCLDFERGKRPTALELLEHPFLWAKESDKSRLNTHVMMSSFERFFDLCVSNPSQCRHLTIRDLPLQLQISKANYNEFPDKIQALLDKKRSGYMNEYKTFLQTQSILFRLKLESINKNEMRFMYSEYMTAMKRKILEKQSKLTEIWNELIADQREIYALQRRMCKIYPTNKVKADLIVNGYINTIVCNYYMPSDIRCIIYFYYLLTEKWNTELKRYVTIDRNKCQTTVESKMCLSSKHEGGTVFGANIITEGRHKWVFKTSNMLHKRYSMNIGMERIHACTSERKKRVQNALCIPYFAKIELTNVEESITIGNNNMTVHVKLFINLLSKTATIAFDFDPKRERIEEIVQEMFDECVQFRNERLNELRKDEMIQSFKLKLNQYLSTTESENICAKEDIIAMVFDFDEKSLKYTVNGADYGTVQITDTKCKKAKAFRLGISFNGPENDIELVDYIQLK